MSLKKLFNFIVFVMVCTIFFMNNVQAKSSEENENGQDTIILSKKDNDVKKYEADKLLFMTSEDDDTTLLFSDSPETVEEDGILYQDTVKGDARLLYYHVNGTDYYIIM